MHLRYRSMTKDIHSMLAVSSITSFFVTDVKCGLYEINKNNSANATHGPSPVQKCSETEPKRRWMGEVQDWDLDLY